MLNMVFRNESKAKGRIRDIPLLFLTVLEAWVLKLRYKHSETFHPWGSPSYAFLSS